MSLRVGAFFVGIIPAYAGSTVLRAGHDVTSPGIAGGSSPHTRGAREIGGDDGTSSGIIPAYAGSTGRAGPGPTHVRDHPRIRGEHPDDLKILVAKKGSSPHTRGAHGDPSS